MKIKIGENIKKLRNEKQITQEQLAEHLLISCQAVSKWENGVSTPDIALIPDIAEYFDVQIDELFKVDMSGYKNKASRLTVKYDMSGKKDDFEKADAEYVRLLESGKADKKDMSEYASLNIYHADNLLKKAEELLNQAISQGEESAENLLITLLAKQGRNNESIEKYEAQIKANSDNVKNWHNLIHAYYPIGRNYFVTANLEKALKTAEKGLEKFPEDAFLHSLCGFIYKGQNNYLKAISCWEKSILLNPCIVDNYHAAAWAYQELGQYEKAITAWEKLIKHYEEGGYFENTARPEREIAKLKSLISPV
ncbi:MAG: helix-turn-helix domain-containing protein [Defluviitaleaceae bacterium]|nr:helix-turn-helix domain-containing protein [Defluviitaleaceae bacterium]